MAVGHKRLKHGAKLFSSAAQARNYIAVGAVAVAIDILIFNLAVQAAAPLNLRSSYLPYAAKLASFGAATMFSFWAQSQFVFKGRKQANRLVKTSFFVIHATGFGLAILPLWVGRTLLGYSSLLMDNVLTIFGTSFAILAKLWLTRRFVFMGE